ncbi:cadmium-translocating P-type ATPase [Paenibacillus alginolyticus]|uniref:heavy metal translocating P-type ATPase n=1 Tax=Paenibacillus alginolyticus TaxID=59839 RepID=UPI0004204466|nr:heavy metal translocating P-type ATPase [Paenibacillus alginolyticus]MCY9670620.1 cadmium-translocating P-type ATPase [Paenibacillus alginolyticus]
MKTSSIGSAEGLVKDQIHSTNASTDKKKIFEWIKKFGEGIAALASGVLIILAWELGHVSHAWSVVIYFLSFAVGGFVKAKEGLHTLITERDLDVNLLMIVAAIGAASIGYWTEGAMLIFIFSLSGALESYTMERSHRDISSLMDLKPETATRYQDGLESIVSIEQLEVGDIVLVKPGERIPADGTVKEGTSAVNQASITGESIPIDKVAGDDVFAGTLNGQGALFIEVTEPSESTLFSKIIRLVQEAQSEKPASQMFIERFERIYARSIIMATLLLIAVPPFLFDWTWKQTLYKAMVFLVVASPCALVASIMPAMLSAISNSARKGLLFKGGAHLENLARIKLVAFDKTGTLTNGRPLVTDLVAFQGYKATEMLQAAASIESLSEHPIARSIVQKATEQGLSFERPTDFQALTGWGVQAEWMGQTWKIGKPTLLGHDMLTEELQSVVDRLEHQGKTVTIIHNSEDVVGVIALQDSIRTQAKQAIAELKNLGIEVAMLTGDQNGTARSIAQDAGISLVYSELLPEDKVSCMKDLKRNYGHVAMVGDGVNDTPALAAATVGIAMGVSGSDAALETADLVLMNDGIENIAAAIALGKRTNSIVKQNIIFSVSVIACLIALNFISGISLPLGVVGHEGSTILVILNGLRLLRG